MQVISAPGIGLIKHFESLRLAPYHDLAGYPTIGWGHKLSDTRWAGLSQWKIITREEADDLLHHDLARFERAVRRLVRVPLSQGQYDALVSFTFNLGIGAFRSSTLLRRLNDGRYAEVPAQINRWVHSGGKRVAGLVRRRKAEVELGLETSWTKPQQEDLADD